MKKLYIILAVVALLIAIPAVVFANGGDKGKAKLKPPTEVTAKIEVEVEDSMLTVHGKAKGMTPGHTYISLFYDVGSLAKGPDACEPTIFGGPGSILGTMFIGVWDVDDKGRGTLWATNTTELSEIGTVSIRDAAINDGRGPLAVVACGKVKVKDD